MAPVVGALGPPGLDNDTGGDVVLMVGVDGFPHQRDDLLAEQRVQSRIVDTKRPMPTNPQVNKSRPLKFGGEGTLRHGAGYSPSPGAWVVRNLRGQIAFDGKVCDTDAATGPEHPENLGQGSALAGREVQDPV